MQLDGARNGRPLIEPQTQEMWSGGYSIGGQLRVLAVTASVAEDMDAENVDLATRVAEECTHPPDHLRVRPFANDTAFVVKLLRNDQKQVMSVRGDVRLPEVLEVVVVRSGATAFNFRDDPAVRRHPEEEVRTALGDEPVLRSQYHFASEAQLILEKVTHVVLDRSTLCVEHMQGKDRLRFAVQVLPQSVGERVDDLQFLPIFVCQC